MDLALHLGLLSHINIPMFESRNQNLHDRDPSYTPASKPE